MKEEKIREKISMLLGAREDASWDEISSIARVQSIMLWGVIQIIRESGREPAEPPPFNPDTEHFCLLLNKYMTSGAWGTGPRPYAAFLDARKRSAGHAE